jgi:hypothetical protein
MALVRTNTKAQQQAKQQQPHTFFLNKDAQLFSNYFEGVRGVVRKSWGGGVLFFHVLLHFYDQIFMNSSKVLFKKYFF